MKKLALVFAGIALIGTSASALVLKPYGSADTTDPDPVYRRIKVGLGTALKGTAMMADLTADDGVTMRSVQTLGQVNVVCVMAEDVVAPNYGLCQLSGYHSGVLARGDQQAITAGGRLEATTAGFVSGANTTNAPLVGIALDAASTSTTVKAFLKL